MASAAPSITLSKKSGPPTSKILVSGRGFDPNVGVDIYFDTKDELLVVTNGQGGFEKAKIQAPRQARPGQHWVTALERNNDKGAQRPFLVQADWRQYYRQDMTRLNPYENLLNRKNVQNLDLKWAYPTEGASACSPVVAEGVVYCTGSAFDDHFYAINAETGALLWSEATNGYTGGAPAARDGAVYFGSSDDNFNALNAHTGAPIWHYTMGGYASSPTVVKGVIYVGSADGNMYALDARTGALLWRYTTGSSVYSSPVVANGVVYFGSTDYNVYAVRASNGEFLWSYQTGNWAGDLAVTRGVVYATSQDHNLYALNASNGESLWTLVTRSDISAPAVANGVVYVGADSPDNSVFALNAATGAKLWSSSIPLPDSPAVANGVVYIPSTYATMYALDASTGAKLWNYPTGDVISSDPTVVNGVVYFASYDAHIYACSLPDNGRAKQDADSKPPDPRTLRPDLSLKPWQPAATPSAAKLRGVGGITSAKRRFR
jgi:outer membrane protein assembly factor BamB